MKDNPLIKKKSIFIEFPHFIFKVYNREIKKKYFSQSIIDYTYEMK